jgi:ferredoxin
LRGKLIVKVVVDRDLCESNARCVQACPEVFSVNEYDRLAVLIERPEERLRAKIEPAVLVARGTRCTSKTDPRQPP